MNYQIIHTDSLPVPVKVYVENRNNSRISMASEHIIIRLPMHISNEEKNKRVKEHIEWAKKQLQQKNYYQHKEKNTAHYQNKVLRICEVDFRIILFPAEGGRNKLSYKQDQIIHIFLRSDLDQNISVAEIRRLLIKFSEKYFLNHVVLRVQHFNSLFFHEKIEKIRLNHTVSKWGSCTAKRNIMFSTKLLLLPLPVIDYVIVHELAHLKEMNHSDKFWIEVERVLPDYKKWDRWLSKNGAAFDF